MKANTLAKAFTAAMLCAASSDAMAQLKESVLDTVYVNARLKVSKERQEFKKNAQSTEVLSAYDLDRNNPAFIEQSLSTMAGVQVDRRTQLGGQRVVLRGYGNDQKFNNWGIKAYFNGIPLTNADGVTMLDNVDFSLVNNIEVIKGPAATLYGGGVGGAIRFYLRPETKEGVSISQNTTTGSFKLLQTGTRVDAVGKNYAVMFNYGHLESDGYRPYSNSLKNNYTFLGNFTINPSQELSIYLTHNYAKENVVGQIPYDDYYAGIDLGNMAYIRKGAVNDFKNTTAAITHTWKIKPNFSNKTIAFFSFYDRKRIAAGAYEINNAPNYGVRTDFKWQKNLGENFTNTLDFGAEHIISRAAISNYRFTGSKDEPMEMRPMSRASYFRYDNYQTSIFAIDRLHYNPWDLSLLLGVSKNFGSYDRFDMLSFPGLLSDYKKDLSFNKSFKSIYTPHIALQKTIAKQIVNLSYSQGFNAPTAATAFITGISKTNDSLVAEKAQMWDFSVQGILFNSKLDYQVSLFHTLVDNKLTQLSATDPSNGAKYSYWGNTGQQLNKGFELNVGYLNKFNSFIQSVEPFVAYSYYDFHYTKFINKGVDYTGKKVVGVPTHKAAAGLDFNFKHGFYLRNTFTYMGDVYTDFANTNLVKGFYLLNAKIGYKKTYGNWDIEAFAGGNNLTNQINYTFLYYGNNINDVDEYSGFGDKPTDLNPGPSKAYFYGGINLKFRIK